MDPEHRSPDYRHILRWIASSNPFYAISAALLLYGLCLIHSQVTRIDARWGWSIFGMLAGYTGLLAATGILVARYGKVWDDARSLLLLLIVMIVASSVAFDRVCLDNTILAAGFLAIGCSFAMAMIELVHGLVRLGWSLRLRLPLHGTIAILYAYPLLLGHFSLTEQDAQMLMGTYVFPWVAAASLATLLPAASSPRQLVNEQITPWKGPWYPWSAFVLLAIACGLRSYGLSLSFEIAKGLESGFQAYYLLPLIWIFVVLGMEVCQVWKSPKLGWIVSLAFIAIMFACGLPGTQLSSAQQRILGLVRSFGLAPIQIAAVLVVLFSLVGWYRRLEAAPFAFAISLAMLATTNRASVSLDTMTPPHGILSSLILVGCCGYAILKKSSGAWSMALAFSTGYIADVIAKDWFPSDRVFIVLYAWVIGSLLIGWAYDRGLGRFVRNRMHWWVLAGIGLGVWRVAMDPTPLPSVLFASMFVLLIISIAYVIRLRRVPDLIATVIAGLATMSSGLRWAFPIGQLTTPNGQGRLWVIVSFALFVVAFAISVWKAGWHRGFLRPSSRADRRARAV